MKYEDAHPSDRQLIQEIEGEISAHDAELVRSHLAACWPCRARRRDIEDAIAGVVRLHQRNFNSELPPADGRRALLKAQLAQQAGAAPRSNWLARTRRLDWVLAAAACGLALLGLFVVRPFVVRSFAGRQTNPIPRAMVVSIPDSRLTPGAAIRADRQTVCAQANTKNKVVPVALQKQVFAEYGIADAEPDAYEVDYLVTPALGGADDIRNLWPQSYSATVWNARVKDALEDRLREMVCGGSLDLTVAQKEIAENWIAAYKKYFHTEQPLER